MAKTLKANSPAAYADVKYVMEIAVNKPGLEYHMTSPGAAINFKHRCNRYRNLVRDMVAESAGNIPGFRAETAFDMLVIRQVNLQKEPDRRGTILIFDHIQTSGVLIDPETGEEISPEIPGVTNVLKEV